ncbi:C-type lectin 4 [Apostichopus japonicus]|uniref:C-type lectin 4 n=1 Tax=Stichopus japonicus TaxID=307972 RepID=A0A2G8KDS0_STIJA|nr:C-type lectin 4 [Apostichopus japonicus]
MASNIFLFVVTLAAILTLAFAACPPGWTQWQQSCYGYQSQVRVSWLDAESNCQAQGGHLVSIGSQEENLFIYNWWVSMLRPLDGTFHEWMYIGYNDLATEGVWEWSDGSLTTFTQWGGDQPAGDNADNCANMVAIIADDIGKWDDGTCDSLRSYICETTL